MYFKDGPYIIQYQIDIINFEELQKCKLNVGVQKRLWNFEGHFDNFRQILTLNVQNHTNVWSRASKSQRFSGVF